MRTYRPLFRQLPSFQFIYISTAAGLQQEAGELFSFLVEGRGLSDLARYFDIQTKWDNRKYSLVTEDDLIFRNQAAKRFSGEIFDTLFRLWRRNQLPNDLRAEVGNDQNRNTKSPVPSCHRAGPGSGIRGQQQKMG